MTPAVRPLLAALAILSSAAAAPSSGAPAAAAQARDPSACDGCTARVGSHGAIEGTLRLRLPPPRRTPPGYQRGAQAPRSAQSVPAVVYLEGHVPGAAGGSGGSSATLAQKDTSFVPSVVVVRVGGAVAFPNFDPFFHNVFSYSGPARFDLGRYPQGESKSVTFGQPGVVKVYCEVHDFMRAAVVVSESGLHAVVGEDGRFTISGVPAGTYTLVAWHTDLGRAETEVRVEEGGTVDVEMTLG